MSIAHKKVIQVIQSEINILEHGVEKKKRYRKWWWRRGR